MWQAICGKSRRISPPFHRSWAGMRYACVTGVVCCFFGLLFAFACNQHCKSAQEPRGNGTACRHSHTRTMRSVQYYRTLQCLKLKIITPFLFSALTRSLFHRAVFSAHFRFYVICCLNFSSSLLSLITALILITSGPALLLSYHIAVSCVC